MQGFQDAQIYNPNSEENICIISNKTIISQAHEFSFNMLNKAKDNKFLPLYTYKWIDEKNLPLQYAELKFILDRARDEYKLQTEIVTIPDFYFHSIFIIRLFYLFFLSYMFIHTSYIFREIKDEWACIFMSFHINQSQHASLLRQFDCANNVIIILQKNVSMKIQESWSCPKPLEFSAIPLSN